MSRLNLSDGISDGFEFEGQLNGKTYIYKAIYPSAKQMRPLQMGYVRLQEIDKELSKLGEDDTKGKKKFEDEIKKISDEMSDTFTSMFEPIPNEDGETMPIADFLDEIPSKAKKNFDEMVKEELL